MIAKKELYERSGVREHWPVDPGSSSVFQYALLDGRYGPATAMLHGGAVKSTAVPGFAWQKRWNLRHNHRR